MAWLAWLRSKQPSSMTATRKLFEKASITVALTHPEVVVPTTMDAVGTQQCQVGQQRRTGETRGFLLVDHDVLRLRCDQRVDLSFAISAVCVRGVCLRSAAGGCSIARFMLACLLILLFVLSLLFLLMRSLGKALPAPASRSQHGESASQASSPQEFDTAGLTLCGQERATHPRERVISEYPHRRDNH